MVTQRFGGLPTTRRPTGFTLLGLFLGWKALSGSLLAIGIGLEPLPDRPPGGLSFVVAVFAAVAAESLWRCRPWCLRATIGYVCAAIAAPLVAEAARGHLTVDQVVASVIGYTLIAALPLWYVADRSAKLFGTRTARVAVPAPHP